MHRKDDQGRGDFEEAFSPVPHASGFHMILALATQNNMHCDHVDISQAFVQGDLLPVTDIMAKFTFLPHPVSMKTLIMSTNCVGPFAACQAQLEPGTTP
jgi:hypothetical protein